MRISKLSIIIPVFNEKDNIKTLLEKVEKVDLGPIEKEIIIVDDFSTDGTREVLKSLDSAHRIIYQEKNFGKGYALRAGFKHATGDYVIVQDADLEYDPEDYIAMLQIAQEKDAKVVYGSRRLKKENLQYSGLSFYLGGLLVTVITNILYNIRLTDEPTCYKMFDKKLLDSIQLDCMRFEFCPEVTAKVAKRGEKIHEVPISYYPRHISEGKKIKWTDGLEAVKVLVKYRFKR